MIRARRGLTVWELITGLLVLAAVVSFAWPRVWTTIHRSRRAEAGWVLSSLQMAEVGSFATLPRAPDAVGTTPVAWPSALPKGWTPPSATARCSYRGDGGKLVAECDVDGDGVRAVYTATISGPIVRTTPETVY